MNKLLLIVFLLLTTSINSFSKTVSQKESIKSIVSSLQDIADNSLKNIELKDDFIDYMYDKGFTHNLDGDYFSFDEEGKSPLTTIHLDKAYKIRISSQCFRENKTSIKHLKKSIKKQIPQVAKFLLKYHKRMFGTQTAVIAKLKTVKLCSTEYDRDIAFETGTLYINNLKFVLTTAFSAQNYRDFRYLFYHWNKGNFLPKGSSIKGLAWSALNPISFPRSALRYYAIQYAKKLDIDISKLTKKANEVVQVEVNGVGNNEQQEEIVRQKILKRLKNYQHGYHATLEKKSLTELIDILARTKKVLNNSNFINNIAEAQAQANVKAIVEKRRKTNLFQGIALVNHGNFHDININFDLFQRYEKYVKVEDIFETTVKQFIAVVNTYSVDIINVSFNLSERAIAAAALSDVINNYDEITE